VPVDARIAHAQGMQLDVGEPRRQHRPRDLQPTMKCVGP